MKILLPIDRDEERAASAADIVRTLGELGGTLHVTILNVRSKPDSSVSRRYENDEELYDEEEFPTSVARVEEILASTNITIERRREYAEPAEKIIEVADEIEADQIVMSGRKQTPVGKVMFGSVTQSVLLNTDVPVTVVMQ